MLIVEVIKMKKTSAFIFAAGLILTILISNGIAVIRDGRRLEQLRGSVLRLHILADSDSEYDQKLKLKVRDALLECGIFEEADSLEEAELTAAERMPEIVETAESVLRENGCDLPVTAELADVEFDERVYGDITMPSGKYRALRVKIGSAQEKTGGALCIRPCVFRLPAAMRKWITTDRRKKFFRMRNSIYFISLKNTECVLLFGIKSRS